VPPALLSTNRVFPSRIVSVSPYLNPVCGSASVATSGTSRMGAAAVFPSGSRVDSDRGTTPTW
jgi:hypothetical protein